MGTVIFRCPNVGAKVQAWFAEDVSDEDVYESVTCSACGSLHLVSPATGRVVGADDDDE
jgi:hypothetical protein